MVQADPEIVLRDGCMNSAKTLIQDALLSRDDLHVFRFWPGFQMILVCSKILLRESNLDSLQTLQQHALYLGNDLYVLHVSSMFRDSALRW